METKADKAINCIRRLVRPIISLALVGVVCWLALQGKIEPKELLILATTVVAFHFGEKAASKK